MNSKPTYRFLLIFLAFFLLIGNSFGQTFCIGTINPSDTTICPGDSVYIQSSLNIYTQTQGFDFNSSTLPSGWSTSGSTFFTSPCALSPSNTPYYWASTATTSPGITTANYDVSQGGFISFEMLYAVQGGVSPCEGPDQYNEGVSVQYSINNGVTWVDMSYYAPNGDVLVSNPAVTTPGASGITPFTVWNTISVPIPTPAMTSSTKFRWTQINSSGSCCDNWGLDNILVYSTASGSGGASNSVVNWSNGLTNTNSFYLTPTGDSSIVALFYDTLGNLQCQSDTITISIHSANGFTFTTSPNAPTVQCTNSSSQVTVNSISSGAILPVTYNWSNGGTTAVGTLTSSSTTPDTIPYIIQVIDACGFVADDTIQLFVSPVTTTYLVQSCFPYTWIDGNTYSTSNNTATYQLSNGSGCDTIVTLNLTIGATSTGTDIQTACDSYTWIDGNTYTSSNNTATHILTNASGCDSVVTLNLTINSSSTGTDFQIAQDSFIWIDGITYYSDTTSATFTLINSVGCDSIVTLNLTIISLNLTITNLSPILIANSAVGSYQWLDCDNGYTAISGETNQTFTANSNGHYAVIITVQTFSDTSICELVANLGISEKSLSAIKLSPNPSNGTFTISIDDFTERTPITIINSVGQIVYETYTDEKVIEINQNFEAGMYFVKINEQQLPLIIE